mgnify:CR=1 FL=1
MSKEKEIGKEKGRIRQLARYYIPYKGLFFTDMFFAMLGAAITLVIPLIVRYITSTVVEKPLEQATGEIIRLGILMIAMVLVEMYCNFYIAYYGHVMGARIEHDMRNEIFGHYQKLSFAFFDNQKVGHLLSRITSDLFDISELLHHGPENIVISFIKLIGAMIILFVVNPMLACVPLVVIVVMLLFALVMNSRMKSAFKENRRRIADINSQIEDSLSGIRVVKSFGNETEEMRKFNAGNDRFVDSKKVSYRYMGIYNSGMGAFSTLITVISLIVGALLMTGGKLGAADLVTFLLYINNCTDPVKKLVNFTEQFQNGYSGYERFLEIMSIAPDIQDKPDALPLKNVQGEVTFENVSFHYEESKENVLSNVNLHVPAGDYVALVGSSGAGKHLDALPRLDVDVGVLHDVHETAAVQTHGNRQAGLGAATGLQRIGCRTTQHGTCHGAGHRAGTTTDGTAGQSAQHRAAQRVELVAGALDLHAAPGTAPSALPPAPPGGPVLRAGHPLGSGAPGGR